MSRGVPSVFGAGLHHPSKMPMGVHEEKPETATLVKSSSSQYFLLNSADRLQNSSISGNLLDAQPWNTFNLQKPAALMNAFASRIAITEVRFPWAIPNITVRNNVFYVRNILTVTDYIITIAVGFYTPSELVAAINGALVTALGAAQVTFSYDSTNQRYTVVDAPGTFYTIGYVPYGNPVNALEYYVNKPSLLKTMGFQLNQISSGGPIPGGITGLTTNTTYTDYVDICSSRLMMNTDTQDGSSANVAAKTSVMMRLFLADESSLTTVEPIGSAYTTNCSAFSATLSAGSTAGAFTILTFQSSTAGTIVGYIAATSVAVTCAWIAVGT